MQDDTLVSNGDGQDISCATGKDTEHESSSGGYKTRRREKGVTIPNNPECIF